MKTMRALWLLLLSMPAFGAPPTTLLYWIEACTDPAATGCRASDPELAQWALEAWQRASDGHLVLRKAAGLQQANIRIHWASGESGQYGETRPIDVMGVRGAEVYIQPTVVPPGIPDTLLREAVVYLTCLHEAGHALGLPHTAAFADIMYSFQYGGDINEYFGRYRRQLKLRVDIRSHSGISPADRQRLLAIYR